MIVVNCLYLCVMLYLLMECFFMSPSGTSDWRGGFARRAEEGPGMGAESGQQRLAESCLVPRHYTEA